MDAVEAAGSGHPGTAMSLAPAAYLLFQRLLRHDPTDPAWIGRDRFVLSCGHSSLTLYIQLFLSGYGLTLDDLKLLRQWGSRTPGHPEHGHTAGVETTTGPLGQGVANAVGMAMAARHERGLFDPDAARRREPFDHTIWCFASDGDMEEGISGEASSIAGHQQLGNLVLLYDDNHISIEGDTKVAFSEDVAQRYEAYGWHVQHVDDVNDVQALDAGAGRRPRAETRPAELHPRALDHRLAGAATSRTPARRTAPRSAPTRSRATKEVLGFDPDDALLLPRRGARPHPRGRRPRPRAARASGSSASPRGRRPTPTRAAELDRISDRRLPDGLGRASFPTSPARRASPTRKASGDVHQRDRAGAARAVGRVRRPRREQQHRRSKAPSSFLPEAARRRRRTAGSCTSASASTPWARS